MKDESIENGNRGSQQPTPHHLTLQEAAQKFQVAGLEPSGLANQEEAFQRCLLFLDGVQKTKGQNLNYSSYGLKHMVEEPGRFCVPPYEDTYTGCVYEGTLILAALSAGFTMLQRGEFLKVTFNISEGSLKKRLKELAISHALESGVTA